MRANETQANFLKTIRIYAMVKGKRDTQLRKAWSHDTPSQEVQGYRTLSGPLPGPAPNALAHSFRVSSSGGWENKA